MTKLMRGRLLLAIVCLAMIAAACGDSDSSDTTAADGTVTQTTAAGGGGDATTSAPPSTEPITVRAAVTGDESTMNPYSYVTGFPGWNLLMMQYDSLMQLDTDGLPQPWLATSVTANETLDQYTIELVDGVTWHDGETFTADDVAFAFDYFISNSHSRFSRALRGLTGVDVVDDLNFTINLDAPNPGFDLVALADVPIIPRHIWEDVTNPEEHQFESGTNVGTGPFRMVDYAPDQSYRFEANPDYFRGAPAIDELVIVQFGDDAGTLAAIRSGEVDVIFSRISPEQIDLLDSQDPLDISQGPEFTTQMINFDTERPPFDDVAVRRAISMAMDRQDIVDTVFLGAATVGSPGWVHPGQPTYNPAVAAVYDPAAANALLEEAGYVDSDGDGIREFDGGPMSFELIANSGDSLRLRISELTAEMLAEIGIDVQVASVESATWEEAVWPGFDVNNGRNYALAAWGWSAPVQANVLRLPTLVHSSTDIGSLNLTGFSNAEVDTLSEQLLVEPDPAVRADLIGQLQVLIADELPFVLLAYPDGPYVYDSSVYDDWTFIAGQGIVSKLSLLPASARP